MRLDTSLTQRMDQRMILAPRMIQSMEILQLPSMALEERIRQEVQENPVLEMKEVTPEEAAAEAPGPEPETAKETAEFEPEGEFDALEAFDRDWESRASEGHRPSRGGLDEAGDKKLDAMQNMPSRPPSFQDYLNDQLSFVDGSPREMKLIRFLITHINERGYVALPLEEIAQGYDEPVTVPELEAALAVIQKLDPPGVGARDAKECLLLQLTPETPHVDLVRLLITDHLQDVAHNRLPIIQRATGYDIPAIMEATEVLRHLNPNPGAQFTPDSTPYVVPDIQVSRNEDGGYDIRLMDDWLPNIYISKRCVDMYRDKQADAKTKEFLKRKIQAAQWLMESIEQRRNTLEKVTRAIIQHQRAFLDKGPEHIEPLKMQQIADQVGVHVTTVSRAVDDKWVQTPRGVFPLKRFFGGGTQTASGEDVAYETIKKKLQEIIDNEDKAEPLSDEDLVHKLSDVGYPVARRTVTKYRKMLNIPSSRQRKDWTAAPTNGSSHHARHEAVDEPAEESHEETPHESLIEAPVIGQ
jgi:RNA polymerase sigma-54 factor